jgi:fructose-bisphosphate aldolase class II
MKYDLKKIMERARKEKWAMGQFNFSNSETLKAVVGAAKNLRSPLIVATSEGESGFLGLRAAAALVRSAREENGLPVFLNLDHARTFQYIKEAVSAGYDTVHFDGSELPLEENIKITKEVVKFAHKKGVLVEGEVGKISGSSEFHQSAPEMKREDLATGQDARRFAEETGVDRLAVNIGTFHGISRTDEKHIDFARLEEISSAVQDRAFLVLHGGSTVSAAEIRQAIGLGICKINVNTELRAAFTENLRQILAENPAEIVPYKYLPRVISAVQQIVEEKIKLFGSQDKI